ncbi:MAG TPA: ATP synthase F1 subunit delta [Cytophagaceae bacterium]|jgi:F-type H+-transporting ATPase subunit delta|nr:ATP synthase F1 subunit delta [Cytophagaceae bacterium]
MQESRVASRYAKSLLLLAQEQNVLDYVLHDMVLFAKVCEENHAFVNTLRSPIIMHSKKLTILKKLFEGKVNPLTIALFEIISRKNREEYLFDTAKSFQVQYRESRNILSGEVTTTFPITDELRKQLKDIASSSFGKEVEITEKINKEIIGGFILKVGDTQIDESVKNKLQRLKNKFKDNSYVAKY